MTHKAEAERFVPELMAGGLIEAEHRARYAFALPHVAGKVVLDAGCGVGWGSALAVESGAGQVIGIDIAGDAVLDAQSRAPEATFVQADMMAVPLADSSIDVVICMEALEHSTDFTRTLDELVRVLRPDGLLFVSSPNPDVYPAGNPFHVHELTPEELLEAARSRFKHVALHRQHTLVTSIVLPEDGDGPGEIAVRSELAGKLARGHDPYSLVVASAEPLPAVEAVEVLVPSQQLTHLDTLATALVEERATMQLDRQQLAAEVERLTAANAEADAGLRRVMAENAKYGADAAVMQAEIAKVRAERDRFSASLVASEQDLARARQAGAEHP